uniref:F-box domain-containing protein n=1 Tax=Manihot esculenta TaxID=3983 RepID=A0A2C9W384_MANES
MVVDYVPKDLVRDILLRLPGKSFIRFRSVCKSWCALFSDSNFIYKTLLSHSEDLNPNLRVLVKSEKRLDFVFFFLSSDRFAMSTIQEIPYPRDIIDKSSSFIDIVGSCFNGLICLRDESNIILWNPKTSETKMLPQSNLLHPPHTFISLGILEFGFDKRTSDYKVLRIFCYLNPPDQSVDYIVEIYSLRDDSWRKIDFCLNDWQLLCHKHDTVYYYYSRGHTGADGVFHWWARDINRNYAIVSFDLSNEVIKTTALPEGIGYSCCRTLFSLNDYVAFSHCNDGNQVELWVLLEYGVKESWTKLYTIPCPQNLCQPVGFSSNGELFFSTWTGQLIVWNPVTKAIVHVKVDGVPQISKRSVTWSPMFLFH